jgi:hypothetical protein
MDMGVRKPEGDAKVKNDRAAGKGIRTVWKCCGWLSDTLNYRLFLTFIWAVVPTD